MANANVVYSRAVNVLKPNKARMAAIHAKHNAEIAEANAFVAAEMARTGLSAKDLYEAACAARNPNETTLEKNSRITLLGMVRRG